MDMADGDIFKISSSRKDTLDICRAISGYVNSCMISYCLILIDCCYRNKNSASLQLDLGE